MTDADSFYDKLLASIGLPYDEPEPLSKSNCKELLQDHRRNDHGRNGEERETLQRPAEPQTKPQQSKSKSQTQPPKPKTKLSRQKSKPEPKPEPRPEARSTSNLISTLPPKPTPSPADLRDRVQSLARKLTVSAPPTPPVTALKSPSEVPSEAPPLPEKPRAKEEPRKPPATLEAELRRKLLENGLRKRKSSPPEGRVLKADGTDKRRKITTSPLPTPPTTTLTIPTPTPPSPPSPPPPPPAPVAPNSVIVETKERDPAAEAEAIKSRQAELRRKLLERSNLIKQKPPLVQSKEDTPQHSFDPARKVNRSYSPIEISSDDDEPLSMSKMLSTLPPFLPPRPPPREGFKIRISVPFPAAPGGTIVLKTEKLPLSTSISTILELFGPARDGDHLYFPGSNPKPTVEIESDEKADLVLGEEGQRFYRDDDDTGREAARAQEAAMSSSKTVIKKEEGWHPQSADSSPAGSSRLRGDAMDYVPGGHLKEPEAAESQWTGLSATLEDIWTRGKKVIDCTLVRAGDGEDDEEEDQGFSERHPPMSLEDRVQGWHPQHQRQNSRGDFATGIEHQWAEERGEEGEEVEEEEGDGEGWGYNEGYPEGGGSNSGMNWGPGYPMVPGQPPGPWNPEQYPMIPNTNIPDPNTQWYATQSYPHSSQPSPVFSPHDEGQGSGFMSGGAQAVQAMHWVPGHMDYANAGWMYGYGPNDVGQPGGGSVVEPTEEAPTAGPVNKVVVDGKLPPQGPGPQQPRVQMGGVKQKRPRGGRQVKKKERRKGGSGGGGVSRNGGGGVGVAG